MSDLINEWKCHLKVLVKLGRSKASKKHLIRELLRAGGKGLVLCIAEVFHNIIYLSFELSEWQRQLFVQRATQVFELSQLTGQRQDIQAIVRNWSLVQLGLAAALEALGNP